MSGNRKSIFVQFKESLMLYGLEYFNRYYGVYAGVCQNNEDPEGLGRIKLSCPQLYGTHQPDIWVVPRGTVAQAGAGIFWVPVKGDKINVSCVNGDARYPMWEWSNWLKEGVPSGAVPGNHLLVTPAGMRIELDDNNEKILIKNKDGYSVDLRSDGIYLGKNEFNLGKFLEDLMSLLEAAKTATSLGAQPLINVAQFTALKGELDNWIKTS